MSGTMVVGSEQLLQVIAETEYGVAVESPTGKWVALGLTEDGEIGAKTSLTKLYGIGSKTFQAKYAGTVENTVRCTLVSPAATQLNYAITRDEDGLLSSFNVAAGKEGAAWLGYGLKFDTLDLEISEEKPLQASMAGIFKTLATTEDTTAVVADQEAPTNLWVPDGLVLTYGGAPDTLVSACRVNIKNNLSPKYTLNGGRVLALLTEGNFDVDATIQTYEPDSSLGSVIDLEDELLACSANDITLVATFTDVCDTASTPATLVITCSGGTYIEKRQPLKANEYAEFTIGITFEDVTIV